MPKVCIGKYELWPVYQLATDTHDDGTETYRTVDIEVTEEFFEKYDTLYKQWVRMQETLKEMSRTS